MIKRWSVLPWPGLLAATGCGAAGETGPAPPLSRAADASAAGQTAMYEVSVRDVSPQGNLRGERSAGARDLLDGPAPQGARIQPAAHGAAVLEPAQNAE